MESLSAIFLSLRGILFPSHVPLLLSLAGNVSWLLITCGAVLLMMSPEKVQHVTLLRRTRRFLSRFGRRVWFFNRRGPVVRFVISAINFCTRGKLTGRPQAALNVTGEPLSVSTAIARWEIPPRGWNPLYVVEYSIVYRSEGDEWQTVEKTANEIRREKEDRTRKWEVKISGLEAGKRYEVRVLTTNRSGECISKPGYFQTYHRPTDAWGFHGDGYTWTQTKSEIELKFQIPKTTRGRQVSVRCNGKELAIRLKLSSEDTSLSEDKSLVDSKLFDAVRSDEVF